MTLASHQGNTSAILKLTQRFVQNGHAVIRAEQANNRRGSADWLPLLRGLVATATPLRVVRVQFGLDFAIGKPSGSGFHFDLSERSCQ